MKKYKLIIGVVVVAVVIAAVALVNTQYQKGAFRLPRGAFRPRTEGIRQTTPFIYYRLTIENDSSSILRVTHVDDRGRSRINCGSVTTDCSEDYQAGTPVTLAVGLADGVDASRYAFTGYTGACTGDVCELTMDSAKTVGVTYREIPSYTLDIVTDSSILRVVDGRGMDCGTVCSRSYPEGTEVILGVSLADGVDASRYAFRRYVSDYAGCTEGSCVLTMDSNKTVRVTHREIPIFATSVSPASPRGAVDAGLDQLIVAFVIRTPSNLTETVEVQSVSLTISQSEYLFQNMVLKDASGNILASVDFTPPPGAPTDSGGAPTDSGSSEVRVFRINSDFFPLLDAEQQETTIYIYADIDDSACASPIEAFLRLEIQPNGVSLFERSTNNWYYTPSSRIMLRKLYITCTGTGE